MVERYGKPLRPWIGVYVARITPPLATAYNLPVREGLIVVRVVLGTPAEAAGVRQGDIIVSVNGSRVTRPAELRGVMEGSIEKGSVTLEIVRGTATLTVEVPVIVEEL